MTQIRHDVRVYTDGRICVTAPILTSFASSCGLTKIPRSIWVTRLRDTHWVLNWSKPRWDHAKKHDLSVRQRILFGSFPRGGEWEAVVIGDSLKVVTAGAPLQSPRSTRPRSRPAQPRRKKGAKKGAKKGTTTKRPSRKTLVKSGGLRLEEALQKKMDTQIARMLVDEFQDVSLIDVVKVLSKDFPNLTVGDILRA